MLTGYREAENSKVGNPSQKWWERKDSDFHDELRKDRTLVADSLKKEHRHRKYVDKLQNDELY